MCLSTKALLLVPALGRVASRAAKAAWCLLEVPIIDPSTINADVERGGRSSCSAAAAALAKSEKCVDLQLMPGHTATRWSH